MSEVIPLYGRIDYPSIILQQINRILAIRSQISVPINRVMVSRYRSAILSLWMISPPVVRSEVGEPPRNCDLAELDAFLVRLRDSLERHGLIAHRFLEVGRPDVDLHEEGA